MARPSDEELRTRAGAPGHGRLLVRADLDRTSAAVVDTNGDGALVDPEALHLDPPDRCLLGIEVC